MEDENDLREWEDLMLATLSLPKASGWTETWALTRHRLLYDDEEKTSLLHVAASAGSERLTEWMLERGADLEVVDEVGTTPLWAACLRGHGGVARMLVDSGASVLARNRSYRNLLHAASSSSSVDVVRYLLGLGIIDVEEMDADGMSPLSVACQMGHLEVAKVLVEEGGADVDVEGRDECGPLFCACSGGRVNVLRWLVRAGAASEVAKDKGVWVAALLEAAERGHVGVLAVLMAINVAVDGVDRGGNTALAAASRRGHVDAVGALVEEGGADVNKAGRWGRTALYSAVVAEKVDVVYLLLRMGADPRIADDDGESAWDRAQEEGHYRIVGLLEAWAGEKTLGTEDK